MKTQEANRLFLIVVMILAVGIQEARASGEASFLLGRSYVSNDLLLADRSSFGGTVGAYAAILGFELGVDYMPVSDFDVAGIDLGASLLNLMGNVVVQAPLGRFAPYGTAGYGIVIADADPELGGTDFLGTFGAFNYGFGAKVFFTDAVGVRVDYRRFAVQTGDDEPDLNIPLTDARIESDPDFDRLMVGLAFRW